MSGGRYQMERGWMDHPLFRGEPFTRAQAWEWMIGEANFKDTRYLKRGQLSHSVRHLATVWQWHRARVERFLSRLKTETMIETETRQGRLVITICNYDKFQASAQPDRDTTETPTETQPRQTRDTTETRQKKEERRKKNNTPPVVPPEGDKPKSVQRRVQLPQDWRDRTTPPPEQARTAADRGWSSADAARQWQHFVDHHLARASTMADWPAAWRTWLSKARTFEGAPKQDAKRERTMEEIRRARGQQSWI